MSSKITLQALAFAGILAVSGLPALAAEMTPATPAPGASVQSDTKAGATARPKDKKASTDVKTGATVSTNKSPQTAKLPAPSASVNGSTDLSVH